MNGGERRAEQFPHLGNYTLTAEYNYNTAIHVLLSRKEADYKICDSSFRSTVTFSHTAAASSSSLVTVSLQVNNSPPQILPAVDFSPHKLSILIIGFLIVLLCLSL